LNWADYSEAVAGSTRLKLPQSTMPLVLIPAFTLEEQRHIAARLKAQFAAVEEARKAAETQLAEFTHFADAVLRESI